MNLKLSPARDGDGKHYTQSPMYQAFLPVLYSLKLGGLYHERDAIRKSKRITSCNQLYSFSIMIALWTTALLSVYPLKDFKRVNPEFLSLLNTILLYFQCAINAVCLFAASYSEKGWKKFFICLSSLDQYGGAYTDSKWLKKIAAISCFIAWFLLIVIFIFGVIMLFGAQLQSSVIPKGLLSDQIFYYLSRIATILALLYLTFCWLFTNCLLLLVGFLVYKESKLYRASLSTKSGQLGCSQVVFENERRRLVEMTRIVKAVDHYLCFRNATAFGFNVINICVLLYVLLYYQINRYDISA